MKQCKLNENHWYSNHLSYCPWCKIANETGKDPFPSSIGSQNPYGIQISVPPARKQPLNPAVTNQPKKNNAVIYKMFFVGIILCLLAFVGNALINGSNGSSKDLQDTQQEVSPMSKDATIPVQSASPAASSHGISPVAGFTTEPSSGNGYAPLDVKFHSSATGAVTTSWDFGDSASSKNAATGTDVEHIYSNVGTYKVVQTVVNPDGTKTAEATIIANRVPTPAVAGFTASVTSGVAPLKVTFTDKSKNTDVVGSTISYDFGENEGSSSYDANPSHTYNNPGTYIVTQTVSNPDNSESSSKKVKITVTKPIHASFTTAVTDLSVRFTDTSTGTPTKWSWDFGNGQGSNLQNPEYTYPSAGTYTIRLSVENGDGSTDVESKEVTVTTVTKPIHASFTTAVTDLSVKFTDTSTSTPIKWSWDFGNGQGSNLQNPEYTYPSAGTYTVRLSVENDDGSTDVESKEVTIEESSVLLKADFSANKVSGEAPLSVQFTSITTGNPTDYYWVFEPSTSSDWNSHHTVTAAHTFKEPGTYTISLTVKNAGVSTTVTKENYIKVN